MTTAIILVVLAAASLAVILRVSLVRTLGVTYGDMVTAEIQPLDVEAFRNLTNPAEDEYLRLHLSPSDFRLVRRERLSATKAYVQVAGRNAAVLIHLGQMALTSPSATTADAARQMVDAALLLRRNCAFALLRIHLAMASPFAHEGGASVLRGYEQLNGSALRLTRMQNPVSPVRISAS